MPIPASQIWTVASYVVRQKLKGRKRYPLVLMLEPLFRCNLACAGCGKIQYPAHILKQQLTPEECFRAVDECGVPTVAIPGGEPLMHPQIHEIVAGLVARKKYIYLCTNALLLKEKLHLFTPSKYLTFSVHMDGQKENHDFSVCREGGYELAADGIREALKRGFRVTTNTTLFDGVEPASIRAFFDDMMELGVEGMMVSPGYSYEKAPDKEHFLGRTRTKKLFRQILSNRKPHWRFNTSPLFLEFLMGKREFQCTAWGMPTFTLFGWQKPCYLMQEGYADSFQELLDSTEWEKYGTESGNPKCANCMMHSGYETSAVDYTFTWRGLLASIRAAFSSYQDDEAMKPLPVRASLVQIQMAPALEVDDEHYTPVANQEQLQGAVWTESSGEDFADWAEKAMDYRGDLTFVLRDGRKLEGYVFDATDDRRLRLILKDRGKVSVPYADVVEMSFTGRDTAAGKSWEAWVKKYMAKKAAGERIPDLQPELLD